MVSVSLLRISINQPKSMYVGVLWAHGYPSPLLCSFYTHTHTHSSMDPVLNCTELAITKHFCLIFLLWLCDPGKKRFVVSIHCRIKVLYPDPSCGPSHLDLIL